jgi:hypothetical protein
MGGQRSLISDTSPRRSRTSAHYSLELAVRKWNSTVQGQPKQSSTQSTMTTDSRWRPQRSADARPNRPPVVAPRRLTLLPSDHPHTFWNMRRPICSYRRMASGIHLSIAGRALLCLAATKRRQEGTDLGCLWERVDSRGGERREFQFGRLWDTLLHVGVGTLFPYRGLQVAILSAIS